MAGLMDKHRLAELLGCKVHFVETNCQARRWPFRMVAGAYRFSESDYEEIMQILARRPEEPRRGRAQPPRGERPAGDGERLRRKHALK